MEAGRVKIYDRISDESYAACSFLSSSSDTYFVGLRKLRSPKVSDDKVLFWGFEGHEIDCTIVFSTIYRKLNCSVCSILKWADEFDWNREGFEGPFKQFWGKRDSYCKACRSKERRQRYLKGKSRQNNKKLESNKYEILEVGDVENEVTDNIVRQMFTGEHIHESIQFT